MSAIKMVSFLWYLPVREFSPFIKLTTMIHPMHMQIDRNLNKNAAGVFTLASCVCMKQTWGLQKVGFGAWGL